MHAKKCFLCISSILHGEFNGISVGNINLMGEKARPESKKIFNACFAFLGNRFSLFWFLFIWPQRTNQRSYVFLTIRLGALPKVFGLSTTNVRILAFTMKLQSGKVKWSLKIWAWYKCKLLKTYIVMPKIWWLSWLPVWRGLIIGSNPESVGKPALLPVSSSLLSWDLY